MFELMVHDHDMDHYSMNVWLDVAIRREYSEFVGKYKNKLIICC
jgi:hypothetical protein